MTFRSMICTSVLAALLSLASCAVGAAPAAVESFDKSSWPALLRSELPTIVMFSSVSCTHCPGALARLAAKRRAAASRTRLVVVSVDADDESPLIADPHYAPADRLMMFRGSTPALLYSVNPDWRGMTPYLAYLNGRGEVSFVLGEPKDSVLSAWLKASK